MDLAEHSAAVVVADIAELRQKDATVLAVQPDLLGVGIAKRLAHAFAPETGKAVRFSKKLTNARSRSFSACRWGWTGASLSHGVPALWRHSVRQFTKEIIDDLRVAFASVCAGFEAELVEFDSEDDHVHLLVNYLPKVAVSALENSLGGRFEPHDPQEAPPQHTAQTVGW